MEAVMLQRSPDQAISPYKSQIRNPKKIRHPIISRPCENFVPSSFQEMGILKAPPPLFSHSYPPFSLQQPPLLPLPLPNPNCRAASRAISCLPPTNKKINNNNNRTRDSSLTPKKSKSFNNSRKENKISTGKSSDCVIISSTTPLGPDPKHLPKDATKVLPPFISSGNIIAHNCSVDTNILSSFKAVVEDPSDKFSGSVVFAISPPPSSLPLPTFSLRPKLSCNAEAVGIDTGATDNLRRLLRLL